MSDQLSADHVVGEDDQGFQATVEHVDDDQRRIAVEIPWLRVAGKLNDAYKELAKGVSVKGFRRGHVPAALLQKMFGKHVHGEVAERLVQENMPRVLEKNEIFALREPEIDDAVIVVDQPFRFSVMVQVVPDIVPKDYFGVEVKQRPAKADDEAVERELSTKQQALTEYLPIEGRPIQAGDVVTFDLLGKIGARPISLDKQTLVLGADNAEPVPGLSAELIGRAAEPAEHDIELRVDSPANEPSDGAEEAAKSTEDARLLVTLHEIKEARAPALDDDFAKDTGEAGSIEELTENIRKKVLAEDEARAREEAQSRLVDQLVDVNGIPAPEPLVERYVQQMFGFQSMMFGGGKDANATAGLADMLRPSAERAVRSSLLIEAIAKAEKVDVEEADVDKKIESLAAQRGTSAAKVRSELQKEGRLAGLRRSLREEKTLDLLMAQSKIIIEEINEESDQDSSDLGSSGGAKIEV